MHRRPTTRDFMRTHGLTASLLRRCAACAVIACAALAQVGTARAAKVDVRVTGAPDPLDDVVLAGIELTSYEQRELSPAQIRRLYGRAEPQIRTALEPFGYYNPTIEGELAERDGGFVASFAVTPGPAVQVTAVELEVLREAAALPLVRRALRRFRPRVGEPLDHVLYETSKRNVLGALVAHGYLDAEIGTHKVSVTRAANTAEIDLGFKIGVRYMYGEVTFSGNHLPADFLARYVPWKRGAYYMQDDLLLLQQRLTDAGYFGVVEVAPDVEQAADGVVPINVALVPAKRNLYTGGFFYGTDTGPGVRGSLERRYVNDRGHKWSIGAELSQRLRTLTSLYTVPLPGPQFRAYNFGATYRDEETDTSESQTLRLAANESREWKGYTRVAGLQFLTGDFTVAEEDGNTTLLYPELVLTKKKTDDPNFTRRGYSLTGIARATCENPLSNTSFVQLRADAKWIRAFGRGRFIARGTLGTTWVDDFGELPPELRYFAGGDRSIRGYEYQAIGPRNERELVVGGENLVVASAEWEQYFTRAWGGAVFVDVGDAYTDAIDTKMGAGVGVRWRSPVGLVRLDLATPISDDFESGIQLHLSIGPDL